MNTQRENYPSEPCSEIYQQHHYLDWIMQATDAGQQEDGPLATARIVDGACGKNAEIQPNPATILCNTHLSELQQLSLDLSEMHAFGQQARKLVSKLCGLEIHTNPALEFHPAPIPILEISPNSGQQDWQTSTDKDQNAA